MDGLGDSVVTNMSVVEKVSKVDLDSAKDEALGRLQAARQVLDDVSASEAAKKKAQSDQLAELVELDRFAEIAEIARSTAISENSEATTVAYALYRLGRVAELREFVQNSAPVGAQLALAQAEYKAGNLDEARQALEKSRELVDQHDLGDITVNLSAISALKGESPVLSDVSTFDANFNFACYLLTRGQPAKALDYLHKALSSAEEEDDRQSAIVQAGFAQLLQGQTQEARELFEQLSDSETAPTLSNSLRLVLQNNLAVLNYDGGLVSAHEVLRAYDDLSKHESELNANQRQILQRNLLKLAARVGLAGTSKRAARHNAAYPNDLAPMVAALTYTKTPKQIKKLAAIPGAEAQAARLWLAAVDESSKLEQPKKLVPGSLGSLLVAVDQALNSENLAEVEAYFKTLEGSPIGLAGLALLRPDEGALDPQGIDALVASIDAAQLDAEGIQAGDTTSVVSKAPKKRKRSGKPKLPSNYDPTKQPDPERWLAKEDRSDYKPKKAKKASQATQGFSGETAEVHTASTSQVVGAKTKKKKKGRK